MKHLLTTFMGLVLLLMICSTALADSTVATQDSDNAPGSGEIAAYEAMYQVTADVAIARIAERESLEQAIGFVNSHQSEFAGSYSTVSDKGTTWNVLVAQGGAAAFDELTALVPASIRINQISVSRSRADLTAIQNELSPYLTSGLADSKIVGIGQDIKSNQVEIEVAGDPSSVSEWLKSNYGDSAYARSGSVELASCPASNSCMPWRGGIQMTGYVNGVAQEECTYTLNARNPNGYLFALTAGHCEGSSTRT